MKIVFLDSSTLGDVSLEPIEKLGELVSYRCSSPSDALQRVSDADVLIVNKVKVNKELMDAAKSLKLICEAATGTDNIDCTEAGRRSISVRNVRGYSTDSVVQLTFAHILSLLTDTRRFDSYVKSGQYSTSSLFTEVSSPYCELAGKTIGIIGMGNIGTKVARIAELFGMTPIYYSTSGTSHCTEYESLSIEDLLRRSDIVSIHSPLNDRTRGLLGRDKLCLMKRTAILVNVARGGIVDETALAELVDAGNIYGAALDVYSTEPLRADSPLLNMKHPERIRFSPHVAWASKEAIQRLVQGIADNISDFLSNQAIDSND